MNTLRQKYIGDKQFYKTVLRIVLPIAVQTGITNLVNFLDNLMVGQLGTAAISGVAITNQLIFCYNLAIFGGVAGAGIFTAQFYGAQDHEGIRNTIRFKFYVALAAFSAALVLFLTCSDSLLNLFLNDTDTASINATLAEGKGYLNIMIFGLLPFAFMQTLTSSLRECRETVLPMKSGILAVLVNLCLNYVLIFGHFGAPAMGVRGAALATVISRYTEFLFIVIAVRLKRDKFPFFTGLLRTMRIPKNLAWRIIRKGTPLLCNELLWSVGMTMLVQSYSLRGLTVIGAFNISNNVMNLFMLVMMAGGNAISIMVGQLLGAGKEKEAVDTDRKLIVFSILLSIGVGIILFAGAGIFPKLYNTEEEVRQTAAGFLRIMALVMPLDAVMNACYFTLRCGGKTIITFVFDSLFVIVVMLPIASLLVRLTDMSILLIYLIVQLTVAFKVVLGLILVKKGVWINNLTKES